jgi:xanthine dehydrogenase accessory factor
MIIASHGRDEERMLAAAVESDVSYVALVASRRRGTAVLDAAGLTAEQRARVHTPAGLDIGARSAPDVAVSILAEVIATRGPAPVPAVTAPTAVGPIPVVPPMAQTDAVCGMTVAASAASLSVEHGGRTWYFCGSGCRDAFADDPGRYGG